MKKQKIKILRIALFLLAVWCCDLRLMGCSSFAQGSPKEEETLFVARKAFEDGFYEVSLGLLARFLQSYPDSPRAAQAELLIGQCFFYQGKFLDALTKF